MKTIDTLDNNVFRHLITTIGALPTSFIDSMSYYEMIAWLVDYLQKEVVPAVNNNAEAVKEIQDWIETLDLQDEVDNKLDEMAESGELAEIIAQYLNTNAVLSFETVADMAASSMLEENSVARTLGFSSSNDGGGNLYQIIKEESASGVDGRNKITLGHDDLYAVAVPSEIDVKKFGAVGDGLTDDTTAIQYCIDHFPGRTIFFPDGTYLITEMLTTSCAEADKVVLKLNEHATIKADDAFTDDFILSVGYTGTGASYGNSTKKCGIEGGSLDCNSVCGGVQIINTHLGFVKDVTILGGIKNGIQIDKPYSGNSSDAHIENVRIFGAEDDVENRTGIVLNGFDNTLDNIRICGYHAGVEINSQGNILNTIHPLFGYDNSETYETTVGFEINAANNTLVNCYADNFSIAVHFTGAYYARFTDLFAYWFNSDNKNHILFKSDTSDFRINANNIYCAFPNAGTNIGLDMTNLPGINTNNGTINTSHIDGLNINYANMTNKMSDPIFLSKILGINTQYFGGLSDGAIDTSKYYPLLVFNDLTMPTKLTVEAGDSIMFELTTHGNLEIDDFNIIRNPYGCRFKLALGQLTGESRSPKVLYIKVIDKGSSTSTNWLMATNITQSYASNIYILDRGSFYSNMAPVSSVPNSIKETGEFINANQEEGFFNTSTWRTTHQVLLKNSANQNRPVLLCVRSGAGIGLYYAFYDTVKTVVENNITTPSFNASSAVLTVTTAANSLVSYVRL